MNKKTVYITREIPKAGIEILKEKFEVIINKEDRALSKEELINNIKNVDAVLTQLTDIIDEEVINNANKVKIFANYAVGYNNINAEYAKNKGIIITNTPDVLSNTTAELAWALLFAVSRRVVEADRYTRSGMWKQFSPKLLLGQDINNKTLGVIGAGRIGQAFAKKSLGFDINILYHNRSRNITFENKYNAKYVDLNTLLKESDIISIHVPLTERTHKLISKKEFEIMKKTSILINTSRGPVVDEIELIKALKEKRIWGAGLDVYENEPYINEELRNLDNVVLLPHIGSATEETRNKMSIIAANNIKEVLCNNNPITPV